MKNNKIQILRAVLFLVILAFHCGIPYTSIGWGGVEVFFVLSAFFMTKKYYSNNRTSVAEYIKNRIGRLYPPYLCVIVVALLYAIVKRAFPYSILPIDFSFHMLSSQNLYWLVTEYNSPMQRMTAHTWTLSIEIWNGLILFLLLKFVPKQKTKSVLFFFVILSVLIRTTMVILGFNSDCIVLFPLSHFDAFAIGALLELHMISKDRTCNDCYGFIQGMIGFLGIIGSVVFLSRKNSISLIEGYKLLGSSNNYCNNIFTVHIFVFVSLLFAFFIKRMYENDGKGSKSSTKIKEIFVLLGDDSYCLYLFHWPILVLISHFISNSWLKFLLVFVVSIIFTFLFGYLYKILLKGRKGKSGTTV